jgi:hypothetical protein
MGVPGRGLYVQWNNGEVRVQPYKTYGCQLRASVTFWAALHSLPKCTVTCHVSDTLWGLAAVTPCPVVEKVPATPYTACLCTQLWAFTACAHSCGHSLLVHTAVGIHCLCTQLWAFTACAHSCGHLLLVHTAVGIHNKSHATKARMVSACHTLPCKHGGCPSLVLCFKLKAVKPAAWCCPDLLHYGLLLHVLFCSTLLAFRPATPMMNSPS